MRHPKENPSQFPTWERERRLKNYISEIRYTLIYSYKIRNMNNKIQMIGTNTREISEEEKLPYPRTVTDGMNLKDKKPQCALILSIPIPQYALNY